MNNDIEYMQKIYNTYEIDWIGGEIKNQSDLTRHHIIKQEHGGENGISNYALLTTNSHIFIHYLEENYYKEYLKLQKSFITLNRSKKPPTEKYYQEVKSIIKKVRKEIKNKRRNRPKKRSM